MEAPLVAAGAFDHVRVGDRLVSVPDMPERLVDKRHIEGSDLRGMFSRELSTLSLSVVNASNH